MIKKIILIVACLSLLAPQAHAQFNFTPLDPANPYTARLQAARDTLVLAYSTYASYYFGYFSNAVTLAALWGAYNRYVQAYQQAVGLRRQYDEYQRNRPDTPNNAIIRGTVLRAGSQPAFRYQPPTPLAGATVTLSTGPSLNARPGEITTLELQIVGTVTTDRNGRFEFRNLAPKNYFYDASAPGFISKGARVTASNTPQDVQIILNTEYPINYFLGNQPAGASPNTGDLNATSGGNVNVNSNANLDNPFK